jgi:hypothetical protein
LLNPTPVEITANHQDIIQGGGGTWGRELTDEPVAVEDGLLDCVPDGWWPDMAI